MICVFCDSARLKGTSAVVKEVNWHLFSYQSTKFMTAEGFIDQGSKS